LPIALTAIIVLGVPSREEQDELLRGLPAYFEANQIHIAALITASYAGEEYSHYLSKSSLGTWLKEQGVPAIYGVDTRAMTKKIREKGSMLGKLMVQKSSAISGKITGAVDSLMGKSENWRDAFENVEWDDPNKKNLVAEGNSYPDILCLIFMLN
jgi:carbamoyl-phosphate synthase/aspartate carbamoyltransferase